MPKRKPHRKGPKYKNVILTSESRELDLDLIDEVCQSTDRGNFRYVAFHRAGVSQRLWRYWVERGRKSRRKREDGRLKGKQSLEEHLLERLEQSEGEMHAECIEDVLDSDDARLKMEFLKLRFNKVYNGKQYDDETGEETKVDAKALLLERLLSILGAPDNG